MSWAKLKIKNKDLTDVKKYTLDHQYILPNTEKSHPIENNFQKNFFKD